MWRAKGQTSHTHPAACQLLQRGSAPRRASSGVNLLFTPTSSHPPQALLSTVSLAGARSHTRHWTPLPWKQKPEWPWLAAGEERQSASPRRLPWFCLPLSASTSKQIPRRCSHQQLCEDRKVVTNALCLKEREKKPQSGCNLTSCFLIICCLETFAMVPVAR